ncbi:MAG: hypothetical protein GY856_20495 [bacterium]|nr:hypothetical protein [bacterium]
MNELWVVNASPIITLAKAGYLHLLSDLAPEFQVPETVARELLAGGPEDPARQALESGWGPRAPVGSIPAQILEWGLAARGETPSGRRRVFSASSASRNPRNILIFLRFRSLI